MALKVIILLLLTWAAHSCADRGVVPRAMDSGETIVIFNHTGHLVQQSSDVCGQGITAKFVLSSSSDQQEFLFGPDTFRSVSLDIELGEVMNIKVYEVISDGDILLIDRNKNFSPEEDASLDLPTIVLCPKDDLQFEGF